MTDKKNRRKFLKGASFTALAIGIAPAIKGMGIFKSKPVVESCNETTLDYYGQGPFYTANPPNIPNNQLADASEVGTRLVIKGRVYNLDCTAFIPNAEIDIWHANDAGQYDNSGYNLRGIVKSDSQGYYTFETIKPGKYLNGSSYRPAHIHVKITPPGHPTLTTQIYFSGDTDIPNDAAASISNGTYDATNRIIPIALNLVGKYEGNWDITVNGTGTTVGAPNIHMNKGILYSVGPNPFTHHTEIKYGVFTDSNVCIEVFNLKGERIETLINKKMNPNKYTIEWSPKHDVESGEYIIGIKMNEIQVHHLKVIYKG